MADMRSILERGVGGSTPPPDGYERMLRRRDRKRRNQRIRAGIVGLTIAIIGFVTTASVIRSGSRPADQNPSPSPPSPTETSGPKFERLASAGIPPNGSDPSLPRVGTLVASFSSETPPRGTDREPALVSAHVYEDGRVIWHCDPEPCSGLGSPGDEPDTGFVQQRLSPSGVELVRSELLATGLLGRHRGRVLLRFPRYLHIEVPGVGRAQTSPDQGLGFPPPPTKAQRQGLERTEDIFLNVGSWLPETGWADRHPRAFIPSHYCLWFYPRPPRDPSDLPPPAGRLMSGKATELTTDEARAVAAGLDAAGVSAYDRGGVAYKLDLPGVERATWMYLEVNLPHGSEC
jgi:hypothetical protein